MKILEKILLATDFSPASKNALKMAIAVAKRLNSKIHLIHVIQHKHLSKSTLEPIKEAAATHLKEKEKEITENGIKIGNSFLVTGSPFDQIIKHADFYDVNVIMMSAGETEDEDHFPLGITAQKVIRKSAKPVWIVKPDSPQEIQKILCPVDFSAPSHRALKNAIHLARSFAAELTVLHVIEPLATGLLKTSVSSEEKQTYLKEQEAQFDQFLKDFDFYHVRWRKEICQGAPHSQILNNVVDTGADLLLMGSTGRTGLARMLIGSVTEKVTREVPCSFIAEKSEDTIRLHLEEMKDTLESHFKEGKALMDQEFLHEAIQEFRRCLSIELDYEAAWQALAVAYERLGETKAAEESRQRAKEIRDRHWQQIVEAEIRSRHTLFGKNRPKSM